jgi:Nickel uptake substrate-specific transmembrane region.
MKKHAFVIALALALPFSAAAHKQWLVPSQATVNGQDVWVTFDAAVSNQLFFPDHVPMRLDNVVATAPDGSQVRLQNASTGKYRSTFDLQLQQEGTYRIANINRGVSASWDTAESLAAKAKAKAEGKPVTGPGAPRGGFLRNATPEELATKIPANAKNLQVTETLGRVETFVTNGRTTDIRLLGEGLELVPVTHPNDLFAGEEAQFVLHIDGKPAAGLEVEVVRGGTRYRNAQEEITATSGKDGSFAITFPEPGIYWLEVTAEDRKTRVAKADKRRLTYVATLEVLPQ